MSAEEGRNEVNALLADALRLSVRLDSAARRFRPALISEVVEQVMADMVKLDERRASLNLSPEDAAIFRDLTHGIQAHLRFLGAGQA
ncbi:MAG TPA: hypothetical protein VFU86_10645 [Terriglobales bacterium]|jgi:hypothetical protein|nr:hypothetical protein [Terriglobales bacterium]